MVKVTNHPLVSTSEKSGLHIMPETAHEVSATLLLNKAGHKVFIGDAFEKYAGPSNIMVKLGTKVSDGYPSCVGFRVFLRTDVAKCTDSGSIEDNYHLVSCRFDPEAGHMGYAHATKEDKQELIEAQTLRKSLEQDRISGPDQDLYRMDFSTTDTKGFLVSRHKPDLRTSNSQIKEIEKLLPFVPCATKLSLFFIADKLLVKHLERAIKHDYVGYGPGTPVHERPEAIQFRNFVRETYPSVRQETSQKVFPVMLDVSDGACCMELPFGASMLNRGNTYAAINALHGLLAAGIASDHIGIITLYPAQVEAYQDALDRCHRYAPDRGYNLVQIGLVEGWVKKTVGIAVIDLVRTSNASGNLGYLSQSTRLKVLLTRHCNGLIVVGDRGCTANSHGAVVSAKLDKVLQWFVDNGRTVQISAKGIPQPAESQLPGSVTSIGEEDSRFRRPLQISLNHIPATKTNSSTFSSNASQSRASSVSDASTLKSARRYVGIPGLEHLRHDDPMNETVIPSIGRKDEAKDLEAVRASFARQGFLDTPGEPSHARDNSPAPSTNPGTPHALLLHESLPKSTNAGHDSMQEARLEATAQFSSEEKFLPSQHARSQRPHALGMEDSAGEVHEEKFPSKKINPFDLPSARSKAQGQQALEKATSLDTDIDARFKDITQRFQIEFGSGVLDDILKESRSKIPNIVQVGLPKTTPASLFDPQQGFSRVETPLVSASHEIDKPAATRKESSPQRSRVKPEAVSPPQTPIVKLLPHKANAKVHSHESSPAVLKENVNMKKDAALKPTPNSSSSEKVNVGFTGPKKDALPHRDHEVPSPTKSKIGQQTEQKPEFTALHQTKYRAIRSLFGTMADMPRDRSGEDQLFRRLAEAVLDEDVGAFERTYTELLGLAAGLQTRELRRA